jgi:single-strand DNA-binding protein
MANLNKVMLIGRLTFDPEKIEIRGVVQGAKFRFAVNNRKLNQDTQKWEDVPVYLDVEVWNRGENSRQADRVLQTLRRGSQVFIEGHLKYDSWTEPEDRGGAKRSKLSVVVENFQYLDPRQDGVGGDMEAGESAPPPRASAPRSASSQRTQARAPAASFDEDEAAPARGPSGGRGAPAQHDEDDIPF